MILPEVIFVEDVNTVNPSFRTDGKLILVFC